MVVQWTVISKAFNTRSKIFENTEPYQPEITFLDTLIHNKHTPTSLTFIENLALTTEGFVNR